MQWRCCGDPILSGGRRAALELASPTGGRTRLVRSISMPRLVAVAEFALEDLDQVPVIASNHIGCNGASTSAAHGRDFALTVRYLTSQARGMCEASLVVQCRVRTYTSALPRRPGVVLLRAARGIHLFRSG
jgi:hypothetical protein